MRRMWVCLTLVGLGGLGSLGGCNDPLFPDDAARTPYERYQLLRGDYRPEVEYDAVGRERPALRQRLRPLDEP